jgi:hypothetical protein
MLKIRPEDMVESPLESARFKSKFQQSPDIINCRRLVRLIRKVPKKDLNDQVNDIREIIKAGFIECMITNYAILDGRHYHDKNCTSDKILVKSHYVGELHLQNDFDETTDEILDKCMFITKYAYSSCLALWDPYRDLPYCFSPIGASCIDTRSFQANNTLNRQGLYYDKNWDYFTAPESMNLKVDIGYSTGGECDMELNTVYIPYPLFYSAQHSILNGYDPTIEDINVVRRENNNFLDENTKVVVTNRASFQNEGIILNEESKSGIFSFIRPDGKSNNLMTDYLMIRSSFSSINMCVEELVLSILQHFIVFQLRELNFSYSFDHKYLLLRSLKFSYDVNPDGFAETISNTLNDSNKIEMNMYNFGIIMGYNYDTTPVSIHLSMNEMCIAIDIYRKGLKDFDDNEMIGIRYRANIHDFINSCPFVFFDEMVNGIPYIPINPEKQGVGYHFGSSNNYSTENQMNRHLSGY